MTDYYKQPDLAALRKLEASLQLDLAEGGTNALVPMLVSRNLPARTGSREIALRELTPRELTVEELLGTDYALVRWLHWWFRFRKAFFVSGAIAGTVLVAMATLWWRLGSGPIELDIATPWLTAAIGENFGSEHTVEVGGTQIERDANGRTALRIRDIVVRDSDGTIVASAPKAEVGVSSSGLIAGRVRAERLSLVGAEMQVRIEPDSKVTVFAGANKRPFVTASASQVPIRLGMPLTPSAERLPPTLPATPMGRNTIPEFGALVAWIGSLGSTGFDGRDLSELGLKNGNLVVDDQRNGKQWTFQNINLSLTRPKPGSVALTLSSDDPERPWLLRAATSQGERGRRIVDLETKRLPAKELMLALRLGDGQYEPDLPVSANIRAEIGSDGIPQMVEGRILVEKGSIVDTEEPLSRIVIDRAEFNLEWDSSRQALVVPFQILSGGNRITLVAQLDAPRVANGVWNMKVTGGTVVLVSGPGDSNPLVLNHFLLRMRIDPESQRIDVEQGEIGNMEVRLAVSGGLDVSDSDPRLTIGVAGTRMSVAAMKRLWPGFLSPKVRSWVDEHIISGTVERIEIGTNAPMSSFRSSGPALPDEGLRIEIAGHGAEIRPVEGLPAIRDADMSIRVSGRTATVNVGRGNIELAPNRKLSITNGVFEVPDTNGHAPPARIRFRIDGPVTAAAELLVSNRLREYSGAPVDPSTSRGTVSAQVSVGMPLQPDLPPGSAQYTINMDVANFAAERLVLGQKVEANNLRVTANNQGYQIKGDVKINGVPASLDYRRPRGDGDAEVRLQATVDDAARARLGFDLGGFVSGHVPLKLNGRISSVDGEGRFAVEADLTQARVDKLLPGWIKPAGRQARASFVAVHKQQMSRLEDFVVESSGVSVKGTIDINDVGEIVAANLPIFHTSDGDKASLKAERGPDGALRVMVRGDVYDARGFIKSSMAGPAPNQASKQMLKDIDVDVRFGTVAGFNGETLRGLDVRMSKRAGVIKSFTLTGKLGRETPLNGDLRGRGGGRNVLYFDTADAGALFRFSDIYQKIYGGEMWLAMDPPGPDALAAQEGILNIRDFAVRGEAALESVAAGSNAPSGQRVPRSQQPGVEFSHLRFEFTRTHGRVAVREGTVKGPIIGATTEGFLDYGKNDVHLRGTLVPLYGLNNMFGQIPIFGLFLGGGSNEGLLGLTYEVAGTPGAPVLRVNPVSVIAPGLLRKFFEFPTGNNRSQTYASDPAGRGN